MRCGERCAAWCGVGSPGVAPPVLTLWGLESVAATGRSPTDEAAAATDGYDALRAPLRRQSTLGSVGLAPLGRQGARIASMHPDTNGPKPPRQGTPRRTDEAAMQQLAPHASLGSLPPPPPLHDPTCWTIDDAIGAFAHAVPRASEAARVAIYGALTHIFDPVRSRAELVNPSSIAHATRAFPAERRRLVLSLLASFYAFVWRAGLLDGLELGRLLLAIERARRGLGLRARVIAPPEPRHGERAEPELLRLALVTEELQFWRRELRGVVDLAALASLVAHLARRDGVPLRFERLDPDAWERELRAAGLAPVEVERRLAAVRALGDVCSRAA